MRGAGDHERASRSARMLIGGGPPHGRRLAILLGVVALLIVAAPSAFAQTGDLVVERFDARIAVHEDGTVRVSEEIEVDFGTAEHHGIFRSIPVAYPLEEGDEQVELPEGREAADFRRVIELRDISVESTAPADVDAGREGEAFAIRIGDPDRTVTGRHTYVLTYAVDGALNAFEDRAELYWNVTGHDWDSPIERTVAVVDAPGVIEASCVRGPEDATTPCEDLEVGADRVEVTTGRLTPGEGVTVAVGFSREAVEVPPPLLEERFRLGRALTGSPLAVPLTVLSTVAAGVVVGLVARRWRRREASTPEVPAYRGDPPGDLRPAQLRLLERGRADDQAVSATLFDLAARGHLTFEDLNDEEDDYRLRRTGDAAAADLHRWERPLWDALLGERETVTSDDFDQDVAKAIQRFREVLEEDAVERGWFPSTPTTIRTRRAVASLAIGGVAIALLVAALAATTFALAAVPLVVAALALIVVLHRRPLASEEGQRLAAETRAFRSYIKEAGGPHLDGQRDPAQLFGRYLPYAAAFGVVTAWVAHFEQLQQPIEQWAPAYYPYAAGSMSGHDYAAGLGSLAGRVTSSTPSPSSSTSSGGGGAGGGFGGGGGGGW